MIGLLGATLAPVASAALPAEPHDSHRHACKHASCPVSPAEAVKPACHGGGAHPAPAAVSCNLASACSCGRDHAPAAPHREPAAVLAVSFFAWSLVPAENLACCPLTFQPVQIPAPEPPPPRPLAAS